MQRGSSKCSVQNLLNTNTGVIMNPASGGMPSSMCHQPQSTPIKTVGASSSTSGDRLEMSKALTVEGHDDGMGMMISQHLAV